MQLFKCEDESTKIHNDILPNREETIVERTKSTKVEGMNDIRSTAKNVAEEFLLTSMQVKFIELEYQRQHKSSTRKIEKSRVCR